MIARLIAWSAKNLMLVFIATAFAVMAGVWAVRTLPLDAIPDLSDTQVIVYTEFPGQAPQVVEDQVTYPLTTAMLTVPRSKVVRGFSFFGVSFVYIIFEDGTDIYWARSRVLEYLNAAAKRLPIGVTPTLGPDASGVGWVYQYAVLGKNKSLADLRSLQDWDIRFGLSKAEGVAEVASVGGFVKQYTVVVDPGRLRALNIPLDKIRDAIRGSNMDVGGRTLELSEHEFMVRGRGYLKGIKDLENIVVKSDGGTPVLLKDVARVELAGDERRGIAELNGEGEVVSGIALQRSGANALTVIDNVKERLKEIAPSLPAGTKIVPVYDRSELIHRAIATLKSTLFEESVVVALVCIVFLLHVRSALVAILMLPVGILMAFVAMKLLGIGSNIMSLGGIAIAIGAMIDAAIVMIENAHKHLERAPPGKPRTEILIEAAAEVGPALFFSLLIITVSFLPIFTLGIAGRADVRSVGIHKNFCHGVGSDPVGDVGTGIDDDLCARSDHPRGEEPVEPRPHCHLPPGPQRRDEGKDPDNCIGDDRPRSVGMAGDAGRQRIHADSQRGYAALYADYATGPFGHKVRRTSANPGPHHPYISGGGFRLRQGGTGANGDGPGSSRNVRDHHQPQAKGANGGPA